MTITNSVVNVTTAGTAVPLASSETLVNKVIIEAKAANTNNIYLGGSSVSATNGITLDAAQVRELEGGSIDGNTDMIDLSTVYIDADTNGEGVKIMTIVY